jgi:enoyl-[acyl-carrier protein] reductase I
MLLQGKRLLITGVLTPQSLAYGIAELAQSEGAEVVLTSFGRGMSLTERSARRLDPVPDVLELDVTNSAHFTRLTETLKASGKPLHGVLHAVAYAPEDALGGNFLNTPWESAATAFRISTFSLKELATAVAPVMTGGGSIVALDFDNSRQAWPIYDWMGVCKAAMISVIRYLARDLGPKNIRVNAVAAGPLVTIAAKGIPGFKQLADTWVLSAPLGWNARDRHPMVAKTVVALLSDWFPGTTAEVVHVDGGRHGIGSPPVDIMEKITAVLSEDVPDPKD